MQTALSPITNPFMRTCVFQLSERPHSVIAKALIGILTRQCEYISPERVERSVAVLTSLSNAAIENIVTQDEQSNLDALWLSREHMIRKIQTLGGEVVTLSVMKSGDAYAVDPQGDLHFYGILEPSRTNKSWMEFANYTLAPMGWSRIRVWDQEERKRSMFLFDQLTSPEELKTLEALRLGFVRCSSPAVMLSFERKFVSRFIPYGDVCLFNPRIGKPYEETLYNDAETALQFLKVKSEIDVENIYSIGFCQGATVAAHLKMEHHDEGMNCVLIHASPSLIGLVEKFGKGLAPLGKSGLEAIKKGTKGENLLNLVQKFRVGEKNDSQVIIAETDTDTFVPPNSGETIEEAAAAVSITRRLTHHSEKKEDGHHEQPLDDPLVWREFRRLLLNRRNSGEGTSSGNAEAH